MRNMSMLSLRILVACTLITLATGCDLISKPRKGMKINERWETSNNTFKVRITAYGEENGGFVGGAYYVFESALAESDRWREIMTFRHDDPVAIPRDQIRFLSDQVGYVFMGWMYAVTTDRGTSWTLWNAERDLPNWKCCNYGLIGAVQVEPDGTGTMKLEPIPGRQGEVPKLLTKDYGQHWSAE